MYECVDKPSEIKELVHLKTTLKTLGPHITRQKISMEENS